MLLLACRSARNNFVFVTPAVPAVHLSRDQEPGSRGLSEMRRKLDSGLKHAGMTRLGCSPRYDANLCK